MWLPNFSHTSAEKYETKLEDFPCESATNRQHLAKLYEFKVSRTASFCFSFSLSPPPLHLLEYIEIHKTERTLAGKWLLCVDECVFGASLTSRGK